MQSALVFMVRPFDILLQIEAVMKFKDPYVYLYSLFYKCKKNISFYVSVNFGIVRCSIQERIENIMKNIINEGHCSTLRL